MSKTPQNPGSIVAQLNADLQRLIAETDKPSLTARARKKLESEIKSVVQGLGEFLNELDPIRQPTAVFDPGNPKIVGRFISLAMVAQHRNSLAAIDRFYGSGIYAVYYNGDFPLYKNISKTETPIYVGKAAPAIKNARSPMEQGAQLCGRLDDHRKSIEKATSTLSLADFEFRSLVVQSGWEAAAEEYLIHLFRPIWNKETKILYGIGKHGDSADTRSNRRSPWDTIHPARNWAANQTLIDAKSVERIQEELAAHFAAHPVFGNLEDLLASFIEELGQV